MSGGNMPAPEAEHINDLLDQFVESVSSHVQRLKLRRAVVRSMLPCSIIGIQDSKTLWVAAEKQSGMPSTTLLDHRSNVFPAQEVFMAAKWEFGLEDPFIVPFPAELLSRDRAARAPAIEAIAASHIASEVERMKKLSQEANMISINPIFGPASFRVDPKLAFVLMPFTDDLTEVYTTIVKPTIEVDARGLVARRADDIKSNKAIIQDIWKSICEASVIIADLTGFNPNVMYELGIAHTLGKETILLYQKTASEPKFPFDLSHIRRIEYENTATGGRSLETQLGETIDSLLQERVGG